MWKQVSGYENAYEINEFGEVRNRKGIVLKPLNRKDGYLQYTLCQNGKRHSCKIHRLVAEHFVENPNEYKIVNHKDGNKRNNHFSNLEWCTSQQNNQHAWDTGLKVASLRQRESARMIITQNRKYRKSIRIEVEDEHY